MNKMTELCQVSNTLVPPPDITCTNPREMKEKASLKYKDWQQNVVLLSHSSLFDCDVFEENSIGGNNCSFTTYIDNNNSVTT